MMEGLTRLIQLPKPGDRVHQYTSPISFRNQISCVFSLQSIPMYAFIVISCSSLEILDPASSCDPVRTLETQYVFNREVWIDLGSIRLRRSQSRVHEVLVPRSGGDAAEGVGSLASSPLSSTSSPFHGLV